jgi:tetratricopeptide (TPR) repeat protein
MTPAEKRYFKVHTGKHVPGGGNPHKLFDAIAAMEVYDEEALLDRFSGESFTNRFAITKRRLYESILRSLDAFHAEHSVDARLARMLHQVEILFHRALYDDASKVLCSAARMARQHDRQGALVSVLEWDRRLLECNNYALATPEELDRIEEQSTNLHAEQIELDALWGLKSRVLLDLYRQGQARDGTGTKRVERLLQEPLLRSPAKLRTAKARFLYHHVHSAAAYATGDLATCSEHLAANRDLIRAERERFMHDPGLALGVLSNLSHVHMRLGRYAEAHEVLREFRSLPGEWDLPGSLDLDLKLFCTSTSLELSLHGQMGTFDKATGELPNIERQLARSESLIGTVRKAGFLYQIAYIHFGAGRPEIAQKWLHRLLNDIRMDESAEIVCFARILYILCLLETGKTDLVHYTLRNTERSMQTRGRTHRFELLFLQMVRGVLKARNDGALKDIYERFLVGTRELETDALEHVVFDHLDPIAWAEARLTGRPFAELVQERAQGMGRAA